MSDDRVSVEERLQRLEEQNEQILGLLGKIAEGSFSYKGKKLPDEKPDFSKVEIALKAALETPELSALVTLDSFEEKDWVAEAKLRGKKQSELGESVCHGRGRERQMWGAWAYGGLVRRP